MRRFAIGLIVVVSSTVASFAALEIGVRVATGSLFEWRNYVTDPVNLVKANILIEFDGQLGWTFKKDRRELGQGPWGNRIHNSAPNTGGTPILAVGDSFTYGSDVGPNDAWPAQLEQMIDLTVINAGVGGYGVDQSVVWAEQLVLQIKPRLLLLSFIQSDITRTKMSIYSGATKPFYRVVNGELKAQNLPLQPYKPSVEFAGFKTVLGYSKLADWTAERLGLQNMWRSARYEYKYEDADDVETSCAFMKRLAKIGVPTVVVGQYGWSDFVPAGKASLDQTKVVLRCAEAAGIATIDTYEPLRKLLPLEQGPAFKEYYVGGTGHMSQKGNALVAGLVAKFIASNGVLGPSPAATTQ
jgi:hypothetical protein